MGNRMAYYFKLTGIAFFLFFAAAAIAGLGYMGWAFMTVGSEVTRAALVRAPSVVLRG